MIPYLKNPTFCPICKNQDTQRIVKRTDPFLIHNLFNHYSRSETANFEAYSCFCCEAFWHFPVHPLRLIYGVVSKIEKILKGKDAKSKSQQEKEQLILEVCQTAKTEILQGYFLVKQKEWESFDFSFDFYKNLANLLAWKEGKWPNGNFKEFVEAYKI